MKKQYITPSTQTRPIAPLTQLMVGSAVVTGLNINGGFVNPGNANSGV